MMPAGILFNFLTKRYHPIIFRNSPFPGGMDGGRYKSGGHHTEGFDTLQDAEAYLASDESKDKGVRDYGRSWFWDGVETPAMIEFFGDAPVTLEPRPPVPEEWLAPAASEEPAPGPK